MENPAYSFKNRTYFLAFYPERLFGVFLSSRKMRKRNVLSFQLFLQRGTCRRMRREFNEGSVGREGEHFSLPKLLPPKGFPSLFKSPLPSFSGVSGLKKDFSRRNAFPPSPIGLPHHAKGFFSGVICGSSGFCICIKPSYKGDLKGIAEGKSFSGSQNDTPGLLDLLKGKSSMLFSPIKEKTEGTLPEKRLNSLIQTLESRPPVGEDGPPTVRTMFPRSLGSTTARTTVTPGFAHLQSSATERTG